jgi:hypothetical protein
MQALPSTGRNVLNNIGESPLLEYKVTFVTNGTHYIWVYGEGDSAPGPGQHDTCNVGLDGELPSTGAGIGGLFYVSLGFFWNNSQGSSGPIATLDVPEAGEHVVDLWMQKDGLAVNQLLLSTDPNYTPPVPPPTESPLNTAAPRMTAENTSNGFVITWTGGGTLYSAPALTGPWTPVTGASGSINIDPVTPHLFYRVER